MMTEPPNTIKPDKKRQKMDEEVSDLAIGLAIAAMRMPDINEPEFARRNPGNNIFVVYYTCATGILKSDYL